MGFMKQAEEQAGREFGARHWRAFTVIHALRVIWPGLALLAAAGGVVVGWLVLAGVLHSHKTAGPITWALVGVVAIAAVGSVVYSIVQRLSGPPRRRRRLR